MIATLGLPMLSMSVSPPPAPSRSPGGVGASQPASAPAASAFHLNLSLPQVWDPNGLQYRTQLPAHVALPAAAAAPSSILPFSSTALSRQPAPYAYAPPHAVGFGGGGGAASGGGASAPTAVVAGTPSAVVPGVTPDPGTVAPTADGGAAAYAGPSAGPSGAPASSTMPVATASAVASSAAPSFWSQHSTEIIAAGAGGVALIGLFLMLRKKK